MRAEKMEGNAAQIFDSQIITYDELSKRLQIPRRTLMRYVSQGRIPCLRIGRHTRFYWPAVVEGFLKRKGIKR